LDKTNSVRTCVTYRRTPNGQTKPSQWDKKLRRNVNETTKIALTYNVEKTRLIPYEHTNVQRNAKQC